MKHDPSQKVTGAGGGLPDLMKTLAEIAEDTRTALRKAIPDELLAEIFASLPPAAKKRIRIKFAEPPVRTRYKIRIRRKKP